jgi:Uma2 family endonuclease
MTTLLAPTTSFQTAQDVLDLLNQLGGISAERVRIIPSPGLATEQDVINADDHEDRLFELVDGVLVEKAMGYKESLWAASIVRRLGNFVVPRKLGFVAGADGMVRLMPGLVRIPDVSFISRQRLPDGMIPREPIPPIAPDLAVEVLSPSNTLREMDRKRREYFQAGCLLVWEVDPDARQVKVYDQPDQFKTLTAQDNLDGGNVLPGFSISLSELFAELDG